MRRLDLIEPTFSDERDDRFLIWFAETRIQTAESFASRVVEVEALARKNGLEISDYSAGSV